MVKCLNSVTDSRSSGSQAVAGGHESVSATSKKGKELDSPRHDRPAIEDSSTESDDPDDGWTSGGASSRGLVSEQTCNGQVSGSAPRSVPVGPKIPPILKPEEVRAKRSPLPLWEMANLHVSPEHHFPMPPEYLNQLHRPMICNMTYWHGDELRTGMMARILMTLATVKAKQEAIFGRNQIPQEHGGGPWYAASRACFDPRRLTPGNDVQHVEVVIKGLTQLTKTPELVFQAFVCFFANGVLPNILVRNRGGANVGTKDMSDGVKEMNKTISAIFDEMAFLYSGHAEFERVKKTDFHLTPRCTSGKPGMQIAEFLDIHGNGNYALKYPQVLISCTNVTTIRRMTETQTGRSLGAEMCMSLIEWASGYRNADDDNDANPHLPYIHNVDDIPAHLLESGQKGTKEFPRAAIALLFDEDDANRSSTGSEKTDKALFKVCPKLEHMVNDMRAKAEASHEEYGSENEGDDGGEEEQQEADQEAQFYESLAKLQLRARVAAIYAYTATPITIIHDVQQSISVVHPIMIELKPGKNYVGYKSERSQQKAPWLKRFIEIEELPNRVRNESFSQTYMYPHVMRRYYDPDFKADDGMPEPFRTTAAGTISLLKRDEGEVIHCNVPGELPVRTAGWIKEQVKKCVKRPRISQFWREDGVNLVKVLRDMEEKKDAYPQGYRNLLYMTNFSRTQQGQTQVVTKMLSGEHALAKGLVCVEYTHKHIRFSWKVVTNDDKKPCVDGNCLLKAVKSLADDTDDPMACSFSQNARMAPAPEGEIAMLETTVANINYAYSVLWKYKEAMREGDPAFFLKVMVVTGEIGGRGVRYKTAKTHQFVLTDMFHAFAVSSKQQITAHGTGTLQAIGRLCTMAANISECPTIKLWIPGDCWKLIKLWMECVDALTDLLEYKRSKGIITMEETLAQATRDPSLPFPHLQQLLTAPTGQNSRGERLYARSTHLSTPCKQLSKTLGEHPSCTPVESLRFDDRQEEMKSAMAEHAVKVAASNAEEDDPEASAAAEGPLPPVAPGEVSVPEPRDLPRRIVNRGKRSECQRPSLGSREERMVSVNANPALKRVYDTVEQHFPMEVGTGHMYDEAGGYGGNEIIDLQDMEDLGGTADDISKKINDSAAINVPAQLKLLVMSGLVGSSEKWKYLKPQMVTRYWVPMDRGNPLAVDEDPSQCSQGSAAKRPRGRPRGKSDSIPFLLLCYPSVSHLC